MTLFSINLYIYVEVKLNRVLLDYFLNSISPIDSGSKNQQNLVPDQKNNSLGTHLIVYFYVLRQLFMYACENRHISHIYNIEI